METIKAPLSEIRYKIREFYNYQKHHFIIMNGLDLGDSLEVQWFFCDYEDSHRVVCFSAIAQYTDIIPTIGDFVESAWATEYEFQDLFGTIVENAKSGFVLDEDSPKAPLRR